MAAVACLDKQLHLLDASSWKELRVLGGFGKMVRHRAPPRSSHSFLLAKVVRCCFASDGRFVACVDRNAQVTVFGASSSSSSSSSE